MSSKVFTIADHPLWKEVDALLATNQASSANGPSDAFPAASYLDSFNAEIKRINDFVEYEHKKLELAAKRLLGNIEKTTDALKGHALIDDMKKKQRRANELIRTYLVRQNEEEEAVKVLKDIATYADEKLGTCCMRLVEHKIVRKRRMNSAFIVVLSDIFEAVRNAEQQDKKDAEWVAPATFERATTKYWVENAKMMELLLSVVTEAPLLVYGSKGRLTAAADMKRSEGDKLWNELASTISSVYFDSSEMYLYKERIARHEGAQLFRVRWYGEKKPQGDKLLFLELKTHHEKWVNTKSVKQRVSIREKDMSKLLARTKWTATDAEKIVKDADPKLVGTELVKATDLLLTMHNLIVTRDLRPCVRSKYKRVAFQSSKSNDLRLTVDRDIMMIDERSAPRGSWSVPDDTITTAMCTPVPFDVFEVKLAGSDMPDTIQSLENRGVIIEAEKFSKFLTGAATFNSSKVGSLPYWAEHPAFHNLFNAHTQRTIPNSFERIQPSNGDLKNVSKAEIKPRSTSVTTSEMTNASPITDDKPKKFLRFFSLQCFSKQPTKAVIAPKRPARVEPKSYFANERTFIQWISASLLLITVSVFLLEFDSQHPEYPMLYVGLLLLACACVIVVYSIFGYFRRVRLLSTGQSYGYVDHFGPGFLSFAIIVGLMALLTIFFAQKVDQRQKARLSSLTIEQKFDVCYQHQIFGISKLDYQPSDVLVDTDKQVLLVPSLDTIQAQPLSMSGLSGDRVGFSGPVITIPGADLEGLVYADGVAYALSEKSKSVSELIAMEWNEGVLEVIQRWDITTPNAEGIAYVPSTNATAGKLYIAGDLATSSDSLTSDVSFRYRGVIDIYDVPSSTSSITGTLTGHRLNAKMLSDGLLDSKISALQYFEDALYVLHDNAKTVRVWDILMGDKLAEWGLPRIDGRIDNQWEGFGLERRFTSNRNLRGGEDDSSLVLHLSLDSPPQVWSLAVKEGATKGAIILPGCAASSDSGLF